MQHQLIKSRSQNVAIEKKELKKRQANQQTNVESLRRASIQSKAKARTNKISLPQLPCSNVVQQ